MILGFGVDLLGFASVDTLPFLAVSLLLLSISTTVPTYPQTHPNFPQWMEQITPYIAISPPPQDQATQK